MNWIKKIIKILFLKPDVEKSIFPNKVEELDDIWVKDGDNLYSGFIYTVTRRRVLVSYYKDGEGFVDKWFLKTDLETKQPITKNNLILYFKKPCS